MNTKLFVLLGGVGAVHLVAGALFIAGGCTQEDPPMPPGIYVPKQSSHEQAVSGPAPAATAGQADFSTSQLPPEPAPTAPQAETREAAPHLAPESKTESRGEKVYIVVKNDSLWLIARKNGLTIEELASYNSLSPKARLRVGQKLYIPPTGKNGVRNAAPRSKGKGKAAPVRKGKGKAAPAGKGKKGGKAAAKSARKSAKGSSKLPPDGIYTVREYDNFSIIAKRFGIKVSDIIAANPGVDSSRLKIGQKLRLTADAAAVPRSKAKAPAKKAKAAKKDSSAAPASKAVPAGTDAAAPAPAPSTQAPADGNKTEANTPEDPEALLNTVKQPQENSEAAPKKDAAPAAPQANAAGLDKDRLVKGKNGKLSVVIGEDISLAKFCRKFTVSEHVIRSQNKNIPSDGQLKAGTSILLIAEDDVI